MAPTTQKGSILKFPTESAEEVWVDELQNVLDDGIKGGNVESFIAFAIMKGGEAGVHIGAIDTKNQIGAYILLGALESMKQRILDALYPVNEA